MWTRSPGPARWHVGTGQSQHDGDPVGTPSLRGPYADERLLLRRGERHPGVPGPVGAVLQPGQSLNSRSAASKWEYVVREMPASAHASATGVPDATT